MKQTLPNADEHQQQQINKIIDLVSTHAPQLTQVMGDSKWSEGNIVFKYPGAEAGDYAFMLGALKNGKTSFHMMPYYGLKTMRDKYDDVFKPYISGKSCINFKSFEDLPEEALIDVIKNGTVEFQPIWQEYHDKKTKN